MPSHNNDFYAKGSVRKRLCFHLSPKMNSLLRLQTMVLASLHRMPYFSHFVFVELPSQLWLSQSTSTNKRANSQTGCPVSYNDWVITGFKESKISFGLLLNLKAGRKSDAVHVINTSYCKSVEHFTIPHVLFLYVYTLCATVVTHYKGFFKVYSTLNSLDTLKLFEQEHANVTGTGPAAKEALFS